MSTAPATTFRRISRGEARQRYVDNETFVLCPCKLRPGYPWAPHSTIHPATNKPVGYEDLWMTFDQVLNAWAYYNTGYEAGYYAHYYIEE